MRAYRSAYWTARTAVVVFALSAAICFPVLFLDNNWRALGLFELAKSVDTFPSVTRSLIISTAWDLSASAVFMLLFVTYRLSTNLRALEADGLVYSPLNAVLAYLIPVLNIWRPMQVMAEISRASDAGDDSSDTSDRTAWKSMPLEPVLRYWGLAWKLVVAALCLHFGYWQALACLGMSHASWAASVGSCRWMFVESVYASFLILCIFVFPFIQKKQDLKAARLQLLPDGSAGGAKAGVGRPDKILVGLVVLALSGLTLDLYVMSSPDRSVAFASYFLGGGANLVKRVIGPNNQLEAVLLSKLGDRYKYWGKLLEAARSYEPAARIFESGSKPDYKNAAQAYLQLGLCYSALKDYSHAEPAFKQALAAIVKLPETTESQLGYVLTHLANSLFKQRKFAEAEPHYQRVLVARRAGKDFRGPSLEVCRTNLLNAFRSQGKLQEAQLLLQEIIFEHEKELSNSKATAGSANSLADELTLLADIQAESGNFEQSELTYKKALKLREKAQDTHSGGLAWNLLDLGWLYKKLGKLEQSEQLMKQAITLDAQLKSGYLPGDYAALAQVYDKQKRYAEADQLYGRAEALIKQDQQLTGFGTPIFAGRVSRLLSQIPAERAVKQFDWASEYVSDQADRSPVWSRKLIVLDLRPVIRDFRTAAPLPAGSAGVKRNSGAVSVANDIGVVILEDQLRTVLAKVNRQEALQSFSWSKPFLPENKSPRESLPAAIIAGTTLPPLSVQDLIPKQIIILNSSDYQKLKKASGLSADEERHLGIERAGDMLRPSK